MAKIYSFDIHARRVTAAKLMSKYLLDKEWAVSEELMHHNDRNPDSAPRAFADLDDLEKRQFLLQFCLDDVNAVLKTWLFEYYVPHNRRWLPPMTLLQCENIISQEISDRVYDDKRLVPLLASHLICAFNEMLGEFIPARSWREMLVRWDEDTCDSLTLMMGEDHRVRWFMENMTDDEGYAMESDFRLLPFHVATDSMSDEVTIRMSKEDFEKLGVVNFKED